MLHIHTDTILYWISFTLALTQKEIKARYKHAILGFLWILLNPLLQMLIIGMVFSYFIPFQIEYYFLYLFIGLLPWNFFSFSLAKTTPMIQFERALIEKAAFPRESLVISIVLSNLFHFVIALLAFLVIAPFFVPLHVPQLFLLPLLLLWLFFFTVGLSLFFSALTVKYRDINFIVQAFLPLWFYLTPVLYQLDFLPSSIRTLFAFNPLAPIILQFQRIISPELTVPLSAVYFSIGITCIVVAVGWKVFKEESKYFEDWV